MRVLSTTLASGRGRIIALVLIGVLGFLIGLLTRLPAVHAWSWLEEGLAAQAYGVRGTAWNGEAAAVVSGPHRLDAVRWNLRPGSLFGAELAYDVRASLGDGRVEGVVRTGLSGSRRLQNIRFDMDANALLQRFGNQALPVTVGGRVEGFLREVVIDADGRLQQISGLVNWVDGNLRFGQGIPLGSYAMRLDSRNGQIAGQVQNTDAVLRLEGNLRLDPASGAVEGEVVMQALEGATESLLQGLRFLGLPEPTDENRVQFSGDINNPLSFRGRLQ